MRRTFVGVGVALLLIGLANAKAPVVGETYKIKLKESPDEGKSIVESTKDKTKSSSKLVDGDGKVLKEESKDTTTETEYTSKVVKKDGEDVVKESRAYKVALERTGKKVEKKSYEGRTVLIEKRGKKFVVSVEGEPELDPKDLKTLTAKANDKSNREFERLVIPEKPVKVGETWKIPEKVLKAIMKEADFDAEQSKGEGKLVKAYQKGKQTWGILEVKFVLAFKKIGPFTFDPPAKMEMTGRVDTAIDGSSTAGKLVTTVKMTGKGSFMNDGKTFTLELSTSGSGTSEKSAEK